MNDEKTTDAKPDAPDSAACDAHWQHDWPSPTKTWLRYFYIGRINYLKGLLLAGVLALVAASIWSPAVGYFVITVAVSYVIVSGAGLYLLYGPPSQRIFDDLFEMGQVTGNDRVVDIHFGTWRFSRTTLQTLPGVTVHAVGVHDPEEESEVAVRDVWKFERPPTGHPRFRDDHGNPSALPVDDQSADVVLLGFGIHEVHSKQERDTLMQELKRILTPDGRVLLVERGWSPLLLFVFGPLFLHFTPAKEWQKWLCDNFKIVHRGSKFGMVDMFVASRPQLDHPNQDQDGGVSAATTG